MFFLYNPLNPEGYYMHIISHYNITLNQTLGNQLEKLLIVKQILLVSMFRNL